MSTQSPTTDFPHPVDVVGLPIRPFDIEGLIETIVRRARDAVRTTGCYANAHTVNLAWKDETYRRALCECDILFADGASVVWAGHFAETPLPCRITAMDYFPLLANRFAREGLSMFLLGCRPGVAERAAARLVNDYPGLKIIGTHHGHFDLSDSDRVVDAINSARPDLLVVGMSSPRQESWLAQHGARLIVPVRWCVGALFDYLAGKEKRAPDWVCALNCEWLFRLAMDPVGKWRRYLFGNPQFVWNVMRWRMGRLNLGTTRSEAMPTVKA